MPQRRLRIVTRRTILWFDCSFSISLSPQRAFLSKKSFFSHLFPIRFESRDDFFFASLCIFILFSSWADIQLVVKNCKNVLESFDKEVEEETMDGENQYHAEGFGLQDARKGVRFVSLPPILMLQLKRFEYNWEIDQMHKVHLFSSYLLF